MNKPGLLSLPAARKVSFHFRDCSPGVESIAKITPVRLTAGTTSSSLIITETSDSDAVWALDADWLDVDAFDVDPPSIKLGNSESELELTGGAGFSLAPGVNTCTGKGVEAGSLQKMTICEKRVSPIPFI